MTEALEQMSDDNIDKVRIDGRALTRIRLAEKKVEVSNGKCAECMYRENSTGHCWYTVTTNKQNLIEDNICKHFVNKQSILTEIARYKSKRR